jgi:hypothetical protein
MGDISLRLMWPEHKANHAPQSSRAFTLPLYLHGVLLKCRKNFSFAIINRLFLWQMLVYLETSFNCFLPDPFHLILDNRASLNDL